MHYSQRGSKIISVILLILFFIGCRHITAEPEWETKTKITFINETSESIRVEGSFDCEISDIAPHTTHIYTHTEFLRGSTSDDRPTVENLSIFVPCSFYYGDAGKCEAAISYRSKNKWENLLETADLEFEFTYRFSEIKKKNAISCE